MGIPYLGLNGGDTVTQRKVFSFDTDRGNRLLAYQRAYFNSLPVDPYQNPHL